MPIYPTVVRQEGTFILTSDPHVFIESLTETNDPDAPIIIYVNFKDNRRWKMWGNCHMCGIGDFDGTLGKDNLRLPDGFELQPGKRIGEAGSVKDLNYNTRLDSPCTPEYDKASRTNARWLGLPYVCGFRFQELNWIY